MSAIRIIGVGHEDRGDDAAGLLVARKLRSLAMPGVEVMEQTVGGLELMDDWDGAHTVIFIDTTKTRHRAGTIHRCDPCNDEIPCDLVRYTNNLSVSEALILARDIDLLPACPMLFGIEGEQYEKPGLTPAVERAIDRAVKLIVEEVHAIMAKKEVLSQDDDF